MPIKLSVVGHDVLGTFTDKAKNYYIVSQITKLKIVSTAKIGL